ncbi:MAG: YceI family protein [Myxococcota bacterium]
MSLEGERALGKKDMKRIITPLLLTSALASPAWADDYVLDRDHTYAYFKVMHMSRGLLTGVFKDVTGSMRIDGDAVQSVQVEIDVASVDTFNAARDAHLKSPDYFNARRYPKMTFRSSAVKQVAEGRYELTGKLQIRGQTKTITVAATRGTTGKDPFGGFRTGGNVTFTIDRRAFGITHMPKELVGDEITIDLYWEALEKSSVETYFANLRKATGG